MTNIKKLKNTHKGERCFVLGNGPSLSNYDLSPLIDEWVFVVNEFYLHPIWSKLKKCIYSHISGESVVFRVEIDDDGNTKETQLQYSKWKYDHLAENEDAILILRDGDREFMGQYLRYKDFYDLIYPDREKYYLELVKGAHIQDGMYLWDISKGVCNAGTSVIESSMSLAQYMGFKEIYLLGCDCTPYKGKVHFYEEDNLPKEYQPNPDDVDDNLVMLKSWRIIGDLFKKKGIKIYNMSKESQIDCFEYKDYSEVIKCL